MDDVTASLQPNEANAPRSACSSCHRRKLKCDRMPAGCGNCKKSNIPCIYTNGTSKSHDNGVDKTTRRRPRGPYQKGKTPREKELEHVVELLHSKCEGLQDQLQALQLSEANTLGSQNVQSAPGAASVPANPEPSRQSEGTDRVRHNSSAPTTTSDQLSPRHSILTSSSPASFSAVTGNAHPTSTQILQMWLIFQSTIDPLTKIVHVPTMTEKILVFKDDTSNTQSSFEFLMFTIYLSVVNTLSHEQVLVMLGRSKDKVLAIYQAFLDQVFAVINLCNSPDLMMLQALVLYLSATRRKKQFASASGAVFGLAVRIAQLLGIDRDEFPNDTPPIEIELRRRCWWTLCRFESSLSEELPRRKLSIMQWSNIPLPGNYNDTDFAPGVMEHPQPRRGLTEMSLTIVIHEVIKLNGTINRVFRSDQQVGNPIALPQKLKEVIQECRHRIEDNVLAYCDISRPLDWLLLLTGKVLLTKVEILALEPPSNQNSKNSDLITIFLDRKVSLSLDVIECHQLMTLEAKLAPWNWSFQSAQQSYAVAYVLEDLAQRPQSSQSDRAWNIINMLFAPQGALGENGSHPEDRESLLELYNTAVQAKTTLQTGMPSHPLMFAPLKDTFDGQQQSQLELQQESNISDSGSVQIAAGTHALNALQSYVNSDPWHLDRTLLDIEGAGVNIDAFFWPSTED